MAEIWDLVDKNGNYSGIKWPRTEHASIPEGLYHPCVEVWVKIGERLLITRRHPDKTEGLKYDSPGGGVGSGESFVEGAVRELYEEVGILDGSSHPLRSDDDIVHTDASVAVGINVLETLLVDLQSCEGT